VFPCRGPNRARREPIKEMEAERPDCEERTHNGINEVGQRKLEKLSGTEDRTSERPILCRRIKAFQADRRGKNKVKKKKERK